MTDKIETLPRRVPSLREALVKSLNEDKDARSDYFDEAYARLLQAKANIARCSTSQHSDAKLSKLQDIEGEALWEVIRAHGVERWQIGAKLELLEELLNTGNDWFDRREFFLLASARMDLEDSEPLRVFDEAHK